MFKMNLDQSIEEIKQAIGEKGVLVYPKLTHDEIELFNTQHNTALPLEYVMFLTEIGDGWKKTKTEQFRSIGMNQLRNSFTRPHNIGKIFPFTDGWLWEDDDNERIFPRESCESDLEYSKRISDLMDATAYGHLTLMDLGDGAGWNLILNGPSKGQIWFICGEGMMPCNPRLTFFDWIKKWLDGKRDISDFT